MATFNPKTTLFFAAFLPQFIDAGAASPLTQGLVLATLFVAIALCTDTLYVLTASSLTEASSSAGRAGSRSVGT